jgi:hypothetical protein
MMEDTDIKHSPWYLVPSADKKRARLICISHILGQIPYEDILPEPIELLAREYQTGYIRPPFDEQTFCAGHLLEPAMAYARCDFRPPKTGSRVKDLSIINFGWGE